MRIALAVQLRRLSTLDVGPRTAITTLGTEL